jgi:hypothetical protein
MGFSIRNLVKYCPNDFENVRGYKKYKDSEIKCDIHHVKEITHGYSKEELKSRGEYYNVPSSDLIILPHDEHARLHNWYKRYKWDRNPMYNHICPLIIYALYVVRGLTIPEVATELNISHGAVARRLKKYGLNKYNKS